ncbi:hypothetical protein Q4577_21025 [Marinovum sp. 2_MG-2023]|uniref:hypothetical protein n=1 Tax=unclassified Marinovum TaxID=2647166 RepID=UPI0026E3AD98|nr:MULTISPECIES: hypothetical protein [unclassified Marinovum]MDO6732516.1 hypothetical protein [Marinovum sp. 2_MG-2023]MDO6780502.1 hypothetical protein [Marinovum sp. 1_MG-2023]
MRAVIFLLCMSLGAVAACSRDDSRQITFDGERFRGTAKTVDKADRRIFIATAGPASRSLDGVREAVRHQGTRYCIRWFGISDIAWDIDPDAEVLPIDSDKVVLKGRCVE